MKRRIGTILALFFFALALPLAGCSSSDDGGNDVDKLIGQWLWSKLVVNGATLDNSPQGYHAGGSTTITPTTNGANVRIVLTLNENKTFTTVTNATIPGEKPTSDVTSGTWSTSGDILTMTAVKDKKTNTISQVFSVSGTKLTLTLSNQQLLDALAVSKVNLSSLKPDQQALLRTLSGTYEFTRL